MTRSLIALALAVPLLLSACTDPPGTDVLGTEAAALTQRLDAIEGAVTEWRSAETLAEAKASAQDGYDVWTPSNNTMPTLPSHPQRIVGWATFTLASDSLDDAHEYAGHAQLHVDVSRAALEPCFG